jgi:hypothetical protein
MSIRQTRRGRRARAKLGGKRIRTWCTKLPKPAKPQNLRLKPADLLFHKQKHAVPRLRNRMSVSLLSRLGLDSRRNHYLQEGHEIEDMECVHGDCEPKDQALYIQQSKTSGMDLYQAKCGGGSRSPQSCDISHESSINYELHVHFK